MLNPTTKHNTNNNDENASRSEKSNDQVRLFALMIFMILATVLSGRAAYSVYFYGPNSSVLWGIAAGVCLVLGKMTIAKWLDPFLIFSASMESLSSKENIQSRSRAIFIGYWLVIIGSAAMAIIFAVVTPTFMATFDQLGFDLPFLTALLPYNFYSWCLGGISLISLVPAINISFYPTQTIGQKNKFKTVFFVLLSVSVLIVLLTILAMYLPIITMS